MLTLMTVVPTLLVCYIAAKLCVTIEILSPSTVVLAVLWYWSPLFSVVLRRTS